jgi:hypothetical protein
MNMVTDAGDKMTNRLYGVYAKDQNGRLLAYTGKAGEEWLSENLGKMFLGYSAEGAQTVADRFNRIHTSMKFQTYTPE